MITFSLGCIVGGWLVLGGILFTVIWAGFILAGKE